MSNTDKHEITDILSHTMIGFIGAGRMAQALARGFISSGLVPANHITASDPNHSSLDGIKDLGITITHTNKEAVCKQNVIILAVKPHMVVPVLKEISPIVPEDCLVMSIAGGIPIKTIEQNLPSKTHVIRVMPNTPALVQCGAAVMSRGTSANDSDVSLAMSLMRCVGICYEERENLLDAVTGISGSGPAYVYVAVEALADGGVKMGLSRDLAIKLAAQTMMGAAKMILETGKHPGQLKDDVCSPGGTTIAAIHSLEKAGYRSALMDAVESATLRSKELGQL